MDPANRSRRWFLPGLGVVKVTLTMLSRFNLRTLLWLGFCPVLRSPAVPGGRTSELDAFRHREVHFVLDDFTQRYVGGAEVFNVRHEWSAQAATSGVQLPHTLRNQIDQDIGVKHGL